MKIIALQKSTHMQLKFDAPKKYGITYNNGEEQTVFLRPSDIHYTKALGLMARRLSPRELAYVEECVERRMEAYAREE